jgi:quinol-cytochrome oxidoreductase complex cytochrome b subunit
MMSSDDAASASGDIRMSAVAGSSGAAELRSSVEAGSAGEAARPQGLGLWGTLEDQLGLRGLISEYLIPVETNTIWYVLGGVLAIALTLEIATGFLLTLKYVPDAGRAYDITKSMLDSTGWHIVLGFHYFNAFLIFALVMVHMMRVFVSGGYRRGKQGLWLVGVSLAGLTFLAFITGESLHWDEVGFAVPWHLSEFLQAIHLSTSGLLHYTFADLKSIDTATARLEQIYAVHIAIAPILLLLFIIMHYFLIRAKGISLPFWHKASGRKAPFSEHIRAWFIYGAIILGAILLLAIFVDRGAGTAPQLLPSSPFYGSEHGPGHLGAKPSFPISWTHGMNVFVANHLHIDPDIWGTVMGIGLMAGALLLVPFLDRGDAEPGSWREAFNFRKRGWAFLAIAVFWTTMLIGVVQNAIAGAG